MWLTWKAETGRNVIFFCWQVSHFRRGQRWETVHALEPWTKDWFRRIPMSSGSFVSCKLSYFPGWNVRTVDVFSIRKLLELLSHKRASLPLRLPPSVSPLPAWSHVTLCELGHGWGHSLWQTIQTMCLLSVHLQEVHWGVLETLAFSHILYTAQSIYRQIYYPWLVGCAWATRPPPSIISNETENSSHSLVNFPLIMFVILIYDGMKCHSRQPCWMETYFPLTPRCKWHHQRQMAVPKTPALEFYCADRKCWLVVCLWVFTPMQMMFHAVTIATKKALTSRFHKHHGCCLHTLGIYITSAADGQTGLPVCVRWCALRWELLVYTFLHPLNWHRCTRFLPSGDASPLASPDRSRPPVLILPGECNTVCTPLQPWVTEPSLPSSGEDGGVLMMAEPRSSPPSPSRSVKELEENSRVGESSSELSEASLLASELKPVASRCWLSWLSSSSLMWGIFGSGSFDLSPQASISLLHRSSWLSNLRSEAET